MNEFSVYRLHRSNRTIALNVTLHYPSTNHSERGRIHLASIVPDVSCPIYDKLDQEMSLKARLVSSLANAATSC